MVGLPDSKKVCFHKPDISIEFEPPRRFTLPPFNTKFDHNGRIEELNFMTGYWLCVRDDGSSSEEVWTSTKGGLMLGVHRDVILGKRAFFEYLRIEQSDDGVFYRASPNGGRTTSFKLVECIGQRAVFENKEHDFPKRIIYWRNSGGDLCAQIEGEIQGTPRVENWVWNLTEF